jgi:GAF domain-containing protein
VAVLPLHSRDRVFGALALYSDQPDAFDQDTLAVLETVADQVAIALDNARLFSQSRTALEAARRAYGEASRQAWAELERARTDVSMRKTRSGAFTVVETQTPHAQAALQTGQVVLGAEDKTVLAVPVKVREQVIGVIDARKPGSSGEWKAEEIRLVETLVEQLGVALESARLYQDTQRRAARERTINTVTARIRGVPTVNAILQRTVEELGRTFGASRASIRVEMSEPAGKA